MSVCTDSTEEYDRMYQTVYKPLARFLYSHPDFKFSFSFTGPQLLYYKKKRNEFLTILKELVERNQVEILGGGFYAPVLPLLFPVDRNTQIDMLSTEIRQTVGKRPRGITMFADIWDSSLVNNLQTCGIEYTLIDNNSIPENKRTFLYNIMHDLGKTVEIFPYYNEFIPASDMAPELFDKNITKAVEKTEKQDDYLQINPDKIVILSMNFETISKLVEAKWFENFAEYLKTNTGTRIKTGIIDEYRKAQNIKIPAYIPTALTQQLNDWCGYLVRNRNKSSFRNTVYNFMEIYPSCRNLYNRITYMTILINQYKNDKMRKKAAREKLLEAQSGNALLCTLNGPYANTRHRQNAYRSLITAEKFLNEDGKFTESISRFDYTNDGLNEYICRMQNYFAYISLLGGAVQELDIMKNCGNYADNLSRVFEYDGAEDGYNRGIFVDHLFAQEQFERYTNGEAAGDGVFSRIYYKDIKFSANRKELQLLAEAEYKPAHQKVTLRKKYIFNSNGLVVQYILKNESSKPLKLKLAVESNFADVNFENGNIGYFNIEVAEKEQVQLLNAKQSTQQYNKSESLKNVEAIRLTDTQKGVSFSFEPNEHCGYFYMPIIFHRPDYYTNQLITTAATFVSTMFWDIEIESGKETEKTINFTITSVKKTKKETKNE
ncbi:MAG: DUF1926 domain-containing protein [Treponema sp.]|nr:DUF1926 domain-containing protein [Treponema sp.]